MGILICRLNGTGKSTLGRTFSSPRSREEVIRLLEERIVENKRFIFAAARSNYGNRLIALLDHTVLIEVPKQICSQRRPGSVKTV